MVPELLLNYSTHQGDLELFAGDWQQVECFVAEQGFTGLELYPVSPYSFAKIPKSLITGIHLRFFIFLRELWRGDREALLALFSTMENVEHFYGGGDAAAIVEAYRAQLALAARLKCDYVVFHPAHVALDHVYDWRFPYHWRDTLALCAEILNTSLEESGFNSWILLENLWWPGSFTLRDRRQYSFLRERITTKKCGIVLDTAHYFNSCGGFTKEREAIASLLDFTRGLGSLRQEVRALHLVSSLSGDYIRNSRQKPPDWQQMDFWQRFECARQHVAQIDPHLAFSDSAICRLFELIAPRHVVFEFHYASIDQWRRKISRQKAALAGCNWWR